MIVNHKGKIERVYRAELSQKLDNILAGVDKLDKLIDKLYDI